MGHPVAPTHATIPRMRLLSAALLLLLPVTASAHIHLTAPLARTDSLQGDQKDPPCGVAGQQRTTRVTTFQPGAVITVTWVEPIDHTGWYRIAFQPNGSSFPIPPASNGPAGNGAASNYPTANQEGLDAATGAIILKDRIPDAMKTTQVTLPDMECNNCTLQFIQLMNDSPTYDGAGDIYFNCADLTLTRNAPMVDAGTNGGPDAPLGGGGAPPSTTGGCSTGGGAGLLAAFGLLGLVRRRRA